MATATTDDNSMCDNNLETVGLLWLDAEVHTSEENRAAQKQIRASINHVITFEETHHCEEYICSVDPYDRLVLIVSGRLGQGIAPRIHELQQLSSIYVYCLDKEKHEKWTRNFVKVSVLLLMLLFCFLSY